MYFSKIDEPQEFLPLAIKKALDFIKTNDFSTLAPGNYPIEGDDIFAMVQHVKTKTMEESKPEIHVKYIDVQYLAKGTEQIGFAYDYGDNEIDEGFLDTRDIVFYKSVKDEGFIQMKEGCVAIFLPSDVHRPSVCIDQPADVIRVVVKVKYSLLNA